MFEMPTYVTAVIPADSKIKELPWALQSLEPGVQSIPVNVQVSVSNSHDGTREWLLAEPTGEHYRAKFRGFKVLEVPPKDEFPAGQRKGKTLEHVYCKAFRQVETEFVLTLDADVMMPPGGLRTLVEAMWQEPKLAGYGFRYDFEVDHLQMGCTLWRVEALKELDWTHNGRCICHWLTNELLGRGHELAHVKHTSARHLQLEQGR